MFLLLWARGVVPRTLPFVPEPMLIKGSEGVGDIFSGKKNPGRNYLLHIESSESNR
jgi:hypothetical protein